MQFRSCAGTGNDKIGFLRNGTRGLGAITFRHCFGFVPRHPFKRPGEDDGLALHRRVADCSDFFIERRDFIKERIESIAIVFLGIEINKRLRHNAANTLDFVQFAPRVVPLIPFSLGVNSCDCYALASAS